MNRILKGLLAALIALSFLWACADEWDYGDYVPQKDLGSGDLQVHFLNMSRNDAILICCGGEYAFIDSGSHIHGEKSAEYMQQLSIDGLKYYIGTHAHTDHVGGAGPILATIGAEKILTNQPLAIKAMLDKAETAAEKKAISNTAYEYVSMGAVYTIGGATLTCIGPKSIVRRANYKDGLENENSLIFRLEYGNVSFVLTGDATSDKLWQLLQDNEHALDCTVFKHPHHNTDMSDRVAQKLKCSYYVFSTGYNYSPSTHQIYNALRTGARVFITSNHNSGTVVFTTDGERVGVETENTLDEKWSLEISKVTLKVGGSKSYSRNMRPSHMIDTLYFSTSDPNVATVDPCIGKITAVGKGSCTVTALAFDGTSRQISVTVK